MFPGQGSQRAGMAAAWREVPAFARWEEAGDLLGRDVRRLGLDAPEDELRAPANCQPALFVHQVVLLETWRTEAGVEPVVVAGHSLGEYNALVAAGALSFADGLRLVDVRARATQEAADQRPGGMVACLGFDVDAVAAACERAGAYVVNDNAPGQVVAAGAPTALEALTTELTEAGPGKVRVLAVGAAYHSPHMEPAVGVLGAALDRARFGDAAVPVVANVDARPHTAAAEWPGLLRAQVTAPVRWRESVAALAAQGATDVVELGAAPVLVGLVKRTDPALRRHHVGGPDDLAAVARELAS